MIECSVCSIKLGAPTTKMVPRAYDQHRSKVSSKQKALNVLLVVGDCMLVGLQARHQKIGKKLLLLISTLQAASNNVVLAVPAFLYAINNYLVYHAGGYGVATGGPLAWGLCYNKEMSPSQTYCDDTYKYTYPCAPGAEYYGRGALPLYWNYNYGAAGEALKVDLLNHPEYIEQNATLAFQAAIWRWMTPVKKNQPSAHEIFVGDWKPTKNDTLAKRYPGFGTTMNVLYGDLVCGQGDVDSMNNIVSHYQYYLDLMGIGREEAGPHEVLTCAEQLPFNPSKPASSSSS